MPRHVKQSNRFLFDWGSYNKGGLSKESFLHWFGSDTCSERDWEELKEIRRCIDDKTYRMPQSTGGALVFERQADEHLVFVGHMDINGRVRKADNISEANPEKRRKPPVRTSGLTRQAKAARKNAVSDRQMTDSKPVEMEIGVVEPASEIGAALPVTMEKHRPKLLQALVREETQLEGGPEAA